MRDYPFVLRLTLVLSLFLLAATCARAQADFVRASVRSVTGSARISPDAQSSSFALKPNIRVEPGNIIETDRDARVVISLSDRGRITVLPKSRVTLKNFQVANSVRELLEIAYGRVIVKIHHIGNKPNPYSLSSPSASIAVRGTEFIVDVLPGGETQVFVREGLVEVSSRNNPGNKRLVTPGGSVIVRPGGDISSAFPGPGGGLGGRPKFSWNMKEDYQRSVDNVAQNSNEIYPIFFSAFSDPHLDSLENPAYAGDFKSADGRLVMLPSEDKLSDSENGRQLDYSVSPQLTFFTPIPGSRFVIGGGVSGFAVRSEDRSDYHGLAYSGSPDNQIMLDEHSRTALKFNALNISFVAAYSFGAQGKTGLGIGVERLSGVGNYLYEFSQVTDEQNIGTYENSHARFTRARLTIGLTHRFSEDKKLGIYYRQGFHTSDQQNQNRDWQTYTDGSNRDFSHSGQSTRNISNISSEIGARFRGALTSRLFYGVEGSYLYERINNPESGSTGPPIGLIVEPGPNGQINVRPAPLNALGYNQYRYMARRARLGAGIGFALNSKTLLNFDFTSGVFSNNRPPQEPVNSDTSIFGSFLSQSSLRSVRGNSISIHAAAQTNLWRGLFLSVSGLLTTRKDLFYQRYLIYGLPTLRNGAFIFPTTEIYSPVNTTETNRYSNFGAGWKFKPDWAVEYLFSIDHRYGEKSNSFKIRYTFNLNITGEK